MKNIKFSIYFITIYILFQSTWVSNGKTFSKCELENILKSRGLTDTANWICLIMSESGGRTHAVGGPNRDGSYDYGLFQVNGNIWCNRGSVGCGLPCSSLQDDNVDDDIECAKKIHRAQGFNAWYGWKKACRGSLGAYTCGGASSGPGPSSSPCSAKGGTCKNRNQCNGNALEKVDGVWGCPHDPKDVWCCMPSGGTGGGSPCAQKGGQCINKGSCQGTALEKVDGGWGCPKDPKDVWCCMPGRDNGGSGDSPCSRKGGRCINKGSCQGTALEKVDGAWGCPKDPKDVWCCMPGGGDSPCARSGGKCINKGSCQGTALEKIDGAWSCPKDPNDVWCCK